MLGMYLDFLESNFASLKNAFIKTNDRISLSLQIVAPCAVIAI